MTNTKKKFFLGPTTTKNTEKRSNGYVAVVSCKPVRKLRETAKIKKILSRLAIKAFSPPPPPLLRA